MSCINNFIKNRENQLLAENKHLKDTNDYLIREISKLAREGISREKKLVKLEAEVTRMLNEYNPNQISIEEYI